MVSKLEYVINKSKGYVSTKQHIHGTAVCSMYCSRFQSLPAHLFDHFYRCALQADLGKFALNCTANIVQA